MNYQVTLKLSDTQLDQEAAEDFAEALVDLAREHLVGAENIELVGVTADPN